jgi:hypothetical protein
MKPQVVVTPRKQTDKQTNKTVNNVYVPAHSFVIRNYVNDDLIVKLIQPF